MIIRVIRSIDNQNREKKNMRRKSFDPNNSYDFWEQEFIGNSDLQPCLAVVLPPVLEGALLLRELQAAVK